MKKRFSFQRNNVVERENFCEWFEMLDTSEDKDVIQTQNENVYNIDDVIPIQIEKTSKNVNYRI